MALRTSLVAQPHLYMGDVTGKPLDYGMVYFGRPNKDPEFYPIDIYYDESLTVAAAQPVRTKGGFLNANGQMVEIYAAETEYSVKVLDGYGRQVFYQESMMSSNTDVSVSTKLPYIGAVTRNQSEKNAEKISIKDFGLVADGVTDDSEKLQDIESALSGQIIDMLGRSIATNFIPDNNTYINGSFVKDGIVARVNATADIKTYGKIIAIGENTPVESYDSTKTLIAIGNGTMGNISGSARSCTAVGLRALYNMESGALYNTAIGGESQYHCKSGTRNISIGDNTMRFNEVGWGNIAIGRNAAQCLMGEHTTAIGNGAMQGSGSLKFKDATTIYNITPHNVNRATIIGNYAGFNGAGTASTAVGSSALYSAKGFSTNNVAIGENAMYSMGTNDGVKGGVVTKFGGEANRGTYTMTATSVTFNITSTTVNVGNWVALKILDGIPLYDTIPYRDPQLYQVKTVTGNTFTVDEPDGIVASGTFELLSVENTSLTPPLTDGNTAVGQAAMYSSKIGKGNTIIGRNAAMNVEGNSNVAVGEFALLNLVTGDGNVAIGERAGRFMQSGSENTSSTEIVAIGANSRTSGNNQIQLGNTGHTTYAYGAVQNRSDERDKIIKGGITDDMIAFFNDVEFKRYQYDYRDNYITHDDDGYVIKLEKDGSKAGKREHLGVVAQQVERAMKAHNIDFAGLQHHEHNGGEDVYTIGYQEFIPILGEIVQRQQKQIDELKALIEK